MGGGAFDTVDRPDTDYPEMVWVSLDRSVNYYALMGDVTFG